MLKTAISIFLFLTFIFIFLISSFFLRTGSRVFDTFISKKYSETDSSLSYDIFSKEGALTFYGIFKDEISRECNLIFENVSLYRLTQIEGFNRIESDSVLQNLGVSIGDTLSHGELQRLKKHLESLPWIEHFSVTSTLFPHTTLIQVREARPWLVVDMESEQWLVSTKGVLLDPLTSIKTPQLILESGQLPRLYLSNPSQRSTSQLSSINERLRYALKSLEYIDLAGGFPFTYETIHLLPMGALLVEPVEDLMGSKVFFKVTSLEEAKDAIERYTKVIYDIRGRDEKVKEIDLRFSQQVVVR